MSYSNLLKHYKEMFEVFDCIHFNSSVTRDVYKSHLTIERNEVIHITHNDIIDCRKERRFESEILQLFFIGNTSTYKGFPLLEGVLTELFNEGETNWELSVWGSQGSSGCTNICFKGSYDSSELSNVFHKDGLLVVPSLWNETFSLITLEALSYGIPTLVSSTVGAKDIVSKYDPWFVFDSKDGLKSRLKALMHERGKLRNFNNATINNDWSHSISTHSKNITDLYNI